MVQAAEHPEPHRRRPFSGRLDHVPRSWIRSHPLWFDVALATCLALLAVVAGRDASLEAHGLALPDSPVSWAVMVGPSAAVAARRAAPTAALLVGAVLQAAMWILVVPDFYLAMPVLLYTAAAHGGRRGTLAGYATGGLLTAFTAAGALTGDAAPYAVAIVGLLSVAALSIGVGVASRTAYTRAVEDRARQLEHSRRADRDRAISEERNRIARELHDVVAHGLAVIVVQASAAQRILDKDPAGAAIALGQIERTGRTALGEMRHVVGALRIDPGETWRPAPGLTALDDLVAELGRAGLPIEVRRTGTEGVELPATVDVTAYRILQESLTNVLKHGGHEARAEVHIVHAPGLLELVVADDGRGPTPDGDGGHGLQGMQERVEVFGGRFEAGRRAVGAGFVVTASLPYEPTTGPTPVTGPATTGQRA